MVRDSVSDFLVRVKNAQAVKKESTVIPFTSLLWEVAKILEEAGYISKIDKKGKRVRKYLEVTLVYANGEGKIKGARRVSRQSQRIYKKARELHSVKHGHGIGVISTSKGVMTTDKARKEGLGGEVLFEMW